MMFVAILNPVILTWAVLGFYNNCLNIIYFTKGLQTAIATCCSPIKIINISKYTEIHIHES